MSKDQAGWRSRQHTTVQNCGKVTQVILWKTTDSNAFHLIEKVKMMGAQCSAPIDPVRMQEYIDNREGKRIWTL